MKIDWDTVELVGPLAPAPVVSDAVERTQALESERTRVTEREQRLYPEKRGRSIVKQILSGAGAKARASGAFHTHTQLKQFIPAGLDMLVYSWDLVAAAMASDRDVSRGVEVAARAIRDASQRLLNSRRPTDASQHLSGPAR